MSLLANGISYENEITVLILCCSAIFFVLLDVILVISLHRRNKKLANNTRLSEPEKEEDTKSSVENQTDC